MKVAIFVALAVLALVHVGEANKIKCLQCPNVLQTCYAKDASEVMCSEKSSCARQVKKTTGKATDDDKLKAIRKCVIPDATNPTGCNDPSQYECTVCSTDLCNSSNSLKISQASIVSLVLASVFFLIH